MSEPEKKPPGPKPRPGEHCSFCGEKARVVSGPCVYICEECAKLVCEIFAENPT